MSNVACGMNMGCGMNGHTIIYVPIGCCNQGGGFNMAGQCTGFNMPEQFSGQCMVGQRMGGQCSGHRPLQVGGNNIGLNMNPQYGCTGGGHGYMGGQCGCHMPRQVGGNMCGQACVGGQSDGIPGGMGGQCGGPCVGQCCLQQHCGNMGCQQGCTVSFRAVSFGVLDIAFRFILFRLHTYMAARCPDSCEPTDLSPSINSKVFSILLPHLFLPFNLILSVPFHFEIVHLSVSICFDCTSGCKPCGRGEPLGHCITLP